MSYKITREASSPANKGPPRLETDGLEYFRAEPKLVRAQDPPPDFSQLLLGKLSLFPWAPDLSPC